MAAGLVELALLVGSAGRLVGLVRLVALVFSWGLVGLTGGLVASAGHFWLVGRGGFVGWAGWWIG